MGAPITGMPGLPPIPPIGVAGAAAGAAMGVIRNASTPPSQGKGGGGGYEFSPEEIDGVIQQWRDLYDGLKEDEFEAEKMVNVQAPGQEFASGDFQKKANPSGEAFVKQNRWMQEYVKRYIQALEKAKGATQTNEENQERMIKDTGDQV